MSSLRIIAIVQARMASSRLPGKVLKDIAGKPMLLHVVERLRMARTPSTVVVATTTDPSDDAVEELVGSITSPATAAAFTMCWTGSTRLPKPTKRMLSFASPPTARCWTPAGG